MSRPLLCDGCGATLDIDAQRLSLSHIEAKNQADTSPFNWTNRISDSWDFCNIACAATWTVGREVQAHHDR